MNRKRITRPIHSNFESVRAQIRALPRLHTYYRIGHVACEQLAATAWLRLEREPDDLSHNLLERLVEAVSGFASDPRRR